MASLVHPLNLEKALRLYDILGKYIPKSGEAHFIEFVGKIIDNIAEDQSGAYADAICLMTEHSLEELKEFPVEHLLKLFASGLTANDILGLRNFCKDIGYGN